MQVPTSMPGKTGYARAAGTALPVPNAALGKHPSGEPLQITGRVRKGEKADFHRMSAEFQACGLPLPRDLSKDEDGRPDLTRSAEMLPIGWPVPLLPALETYTAPVNARRPRWTARCRRCRK